MRIISGFTVCTAILFSSCRYTPAGGDYSSIQGFTQGTTYRITYQSPEQTDLTTRIDSLFHLFDQSLSIYLPSSIISAINDNREMVETDTLFRTVFREAQRVYQMTGGAFDITVGPLINAWGFGPGEQQDVDSTLVDSLLQFVGMDKVEMVNGMVQKRYPEVKLDVNAIAQGYSVDVVAAFLEDLGCQNYLVEVGGEIRTLGKNSRGTYWKIGVDRPEYGNMIPGQQLQAIINMHNRSMASSGNYRSYFEKDGVRITHTIDPATGFPKESRLLSVTILSEHCITADAYATACMVMGLEKAKAFMGEIRNADAYFIYGDENGAYKVWLTPGLKKYIESP